MIIVKGYKSSPEEVATSCDVTFSMLVDPKSAVDVSCGKHGAANGMGPRKGCYIKVQSSSFRFIKISRRWTIDISYSRGHESL
ncbi:glyoxylate/succinic semialdehyde reductase 2, chloroplastic-like isoform X2 [Cicer arietinum]|uniref:glyoxylate/succinic semialdehyde reductase 2, chloroplastic-like isoform X2 n=1 Tax=Cicer arietinum TaxID=3827 RepID=UPI003CC5C45C